MKYLGDDGYDEYLQGSYERTLCEHSEDCDGDCDNCEWSQVSQAEINAEIRWGTGDGQDD